MRPEKKLLLEEITDKIKSSNAMIIAKYDNIKPNVSWEFRCTLSKSDADFEVVKKRVFLKAAASCGLELDISQLQGNIGVAFIGENAVDSTKAFVKFSEANGDLFEILLGKYDEKVYQPSDVIALSRLPSKDEMRAQFLGLLEAPMSQTLSVMQSLLTSVMYCLENKSKESN